MLVNVTRLPGGSGGDQGAPVRAGSGDLFDRLRLRVGRVAVDEERVKPLERGRTRVPVG